MELLVLFSPTEFFLPLTEGTENTDFLLAALVVIFRQNYIRTFFLLDIRLAMPLAYLSEKKTDWLRPAIVRTLEPSVPTSTFNFSFLTPIYLTEKPFSVILYLCNLLLGLSGIVISTNPKERAGCKYLSLKLCLSFNPNRSIISTTLLSPSFNINNNTLTWGVTLGGDLGGGDLGGDTFCNSLNCRNHPSSGNLKCRHRQSCRLKLSVPTLNFYNIKLCRRCNAPKTLFVAKELRP